MTELYLIELWSYLDNRINLLGGLEDGSIDMRKHVRGIWNDHFTHESEFPNLFPTEQVKEVFGTQFVPVYWGNVRVREEDL